MGVGVVIDIRRGLPRVQVEVPTPSPPARRALPPLHRVGSPSSGCRRTTPNCSCRRCCNTSANVSHRPLTRVVPVWRARRPLSLRSLRTPRVGPQTCTHTPRLPLASHSIFFRHSLPGFIELDPQLAVPRRVQAPRHRSSKRTRPGLVRQRRRNSRNFDEHAPRTASPPHVAVSPPPPPPAHSPIPTRRLRMRCLQFLLLWVRFHSWCGDATRHRLHFPSASNSGLTLKLKPAQLHGRQRESRLTLHHHKPIHVRGCGHSCTARRVPAPAKFHSLNAACGEAHAAVKRSVRRPPSLHMQRSTAKSTKLNRRRAPSFHLPTQASTPARS
ncbi:hypothetical protein C8R43DRAFT_494714 [Mycena crocata]|nr:hypothetical protein C8R43DRAFT_494714 [Mycena crocata]